MATELTHEQHIEQLVREWKWDRHINSQPWDFNSLAARAFEAGRNRAKQAAKPIASPLP